MAVPKGERVGGCVLNTGIDAAGLGMKVRVLDYLKKEDAGTDLLVDTMKRYGLDTSAIRYGDDVDNGRCLIMTKGNEKCIYVIPQRHPFFDEEEKDIQELLEGSTLIYSLVHLMRECFREPVKLIKDLKEKGVKFAFDGSSQYQDESEVEELALADHIFLNRQAYGRIEEILKTEPARWFLERGVRTLCVTDGSRGSDCFTKEGLVHMDAVKIGHVVDSTGAGDAFAAAFLTAFYNGLSEEECLKRATHMGARKCLYEGGFGGVCSQEELEDFIKERER